MARRHILTQAMPGWVRITAAQFVNIVLAAEVGSFSLTGKDVEFLRNTGGINAGVGTYTITGKAAAFLRGLVTSAGSGAFVVGGQGAVIGRQFSMSSGAAAFALTGQDAAFVRALSLAAGAGSHALSGISSGLVVGLVLAAQAGAFSLAGQNALFNIATGYSLAAGAASFLVTGQNAGLLHAFSLAGSAGSFAVSGQDAALVSASSLAAAVGSYALTGQDATASRTFTFVGSCVANGSALNFSSLSAGSVTAGDLLVYIDQAYNIEIIPSAVTPSGFSNLVNTSGGGGADPALRGMISVKKAAGSEGSITGMNDTQEQKIGLVFRPSSSFTTISANDIASLAQISNPASQNCDPSAETVAVIVLGVAAIEAGTAAFSTESPAFGGTVSVSDSDMIVGYKIYNSSPAAHTIDMNDLGGINWLASLYLTVS